MDGAAIVDIAREGLFLVVLLAGPPVGAALVAGLAVSIVQTATQIQEQTVGFAVRAAAVVAALIVAGPWIGAQLQTFSVAVFAAIGQVDTP